MLINRHINHLSSLALLTFVASMGCGESKPKPRELTSTQEAPSIRRPSVPTEGAKAVLEDLGIPIPEASRTFNSDPTDLTDLLDPTERNSNPNLAPTALADTAIGRRPPLQTVDSPLGSSNFFERPPQWILEDELPLDLWQIQYIGNTPVGYVQQKILPSAIGASGIIRIEIESMLRASRQQNRPAQRISIVSIEESDGQLRTIAIRMAQGDTKTTIDGNVVLGKLRLKTVANGRTTNKEIPWRPEYGGPFAVEQSLRGSPMKPKEIRNLILLDPILAELVTVRLEALDFVRTPMLDGLQPNLLEIRSTVTRGDSSLTSTIWVDPIGQTQKSYSRSLDIRSYQCEPSIAASVRDQQEVYRLTRRELTVPDLPNNLKERSELTYRVTHPERDPRRFFAGHSNISVKSIDPNTADVTVSRFDRSNTTSTTSISTQNDSSEAQAPPDPSFVESTPQLQLDDRIVQRLANEFAQVNPDATTDTDLVERLRAGVYAWIDPKLPFQGTLVSAAQAARSRTGDSSHHAVLLAALMRSHGIPTRVAAGLVASQLLEEPTADSSSNMVVHLWTEAFLDGQWIGLDASRPEGTINAGYLKFFDSKLDDHNPYALLLEVLSQIDKIEITAKPQ